MSMKKETVNLNHDDLKKQLKDSPTRKYNRCGDLFNGTYFLGYKIKLRDCEQEIFLFSDGSHKLNWDDEVFENEIDMQEFQITNQGISRFIEEQHIPDKAKLYGRIISILKEYQDLTDDTEYDFVALWILHTPLVNLFGVTPYIDLEGDAGTGKSNLMKVCKRLVNKGEIITSPTKATLFRSIDNNQNTLFLDEFENYHKDMKQDVLDVINDGYTKGSYIKRCGSTNYETVMKYKTFCPKMFASVSENTIRTLKSRSITINTLRTDKKLKDIDFLHEDEIKLFDELRDDIIIWSLRNCKEIMQIYGSIQLDTIGGRDLQIIKPIVALAEMFGIKDKLLSWYRGFVDEREDDFREQDWSFKFLKYLYDRVRDNSIIAITPTEMANELNDIYIPTEDRFKQTPKSVGHRLNKRLNFNKYKKHTSTGKEYELPASAIVNRIKRFGYSKYFDKVELDKLDKGNNKIEVSDHTDSPENFRKIQEEITEAVE